MSEGNPVVARWARLEGHEFDLANAAAAFQHTVVCRIDLDDDGHHYLKAPKLYEIEDEWEFKRVAQEFLDRINGAMKAALGAAYDPIRFKQVVPIRENGGKDVVVLVPTAELRVSRGKNTAFSSGQDTSEPKPSRPEGWITRTVEDEDLADAFVYIGREASWFDLYKASEVIDRRIGSRKKVISALSNAHDRTRLSSELKRFDRTANTLHRHWNRKYQVPKNPMTLKEAQALIIDLVRRFAVWIEATPP